MPENSIDYRGHKISVHRERCLGGWGMLYYSVFTKGGHELLSRFSDSEDTVETYVGFMKKRIDSALDGDDAYGLHADLTPQERAAILRWHRRQPEGREAFQRWHRDELEATRA